MEPTTKTDLEHYVLIADLLAYPTEGFADRVRTVQSYLNVHYPEAWAELQPFCDLLPGDDLRAMQQSYTRAFDVQAATTLDLGYVLFGDDYKRGKLLANLSREQTDAGNDCGTELADHLPNILRLLPKLADRGLVVELVQEIVAVALRKMIAEFETDAFAQKDKLYKKHHKTLIEFVPGTRAMYAFVLKALYAVLAADFVLTETALIEQTSDFLGSVGTEFEIEETEARPSQAVGG